MFLQVLFGQVYTSPLNKDTTGFAPCLLRLCIGSVIVNCEESFSIIIQVQ